MIEIHGSVGRGGANRFHDVGIAEPHAVTMPRYASSAPLVRGAEYWLTQFHGDYKREADPSCEAFEVGQKSHKFFLAGFSGFFAEIEFSLDDQNPPASIRSVELLTLVERTNHRVAYIS